MGILFLTLIPVDGFFIYFSTYLYCTVVLTPKVFLKGCHKSPLATALVLCCALGLLCNQVFILRAMLDCDRHCPLFTYTCAWCGTG